MLTSVPVWGIAATQITESFGFYVLFTELPTYMKNILHFDLKSSAVLSAVPYLAYWLTGIVGSTLVDLVIQRGLVSTTMARKMANTIATVVPAAALVGNPSGLFL